MVEHIFISFSVILLAVVFLAAGIAKIRSVDTLEGVVQNFRILPARLARPFALVLPPTELAVAAALVAPATRTYGAIAATALLLVFMIAIAVNLARGRREIDCVAETIWKQDVALALLRVRKPRLKQNTTSNWYLLIDILCRSKSMKIRRLEPRFRCPLYCVD